MHSSCPWRLRPLEASVGPTWLCWAGSCGVLLCRWLVFLLRAVTWKEHILFSVISPQRRFSNYVLCPRSVLILFLRPYNGLTRRFIVVPFCFSFDPLVFDVLLYVLKVGFLLYVRLFITARIFIIWSYFTMLCSKFVDCILQGFYLNRTGQTFW